MKKNLLILGLTAALAVVGLNETEAGRDQDLPFGTYINDGAVGKWEYNYPDRYSTEIYVEGTTWDDGRQTPIKSVTWDIWTISSNGKKREFYKSLGTTRPEYFNTFSMSVNKYTLKKGYYQLRAKIHYKNRNSNTVWYSKSFRGGK